MKLLHNKHKFITAFVFCFAFLMVGFLGNHQMQAYALSPGMNVRVHSETDIRNYIRNSNASLSDSMVLIRNPYLELPYDTGRLSDATQQSALNMLNQIRYIAGLSSVTLSDSYSQYAQAAAFVSYMNGQVSKNPIQPWGMDSSMYQTASHGASNSAQHWTNWGGRSLNDTIVSGMMGASDSANMSTLENRRWLLNPQMGSTGFGGLSGLKGTYVSVYTGDKSNPSALESGVAWPAQIMPAEYFSIDSPWSISLGQPVNANRVQVTLTRLSDYKTWTFSNTLSDGDFFVDNNYYGQTGCIIFRPRLDSANAYRSGEAYRVMVTGDFTTITYNVQFFALNIPRTTYTTAFDSQGGSSVSSIVVNEGGTISQLPVPTKSNAEFLGWYTSPNGQGAKLTTSTVINVNRTYYAYWSNRVSFTDLSVSYTGDAYEGMDIASGLTVSAKYSDGHSERVYNYTVSPRTFAGGLNTITVTYGGKTKQINLVAKYRTNNFVNDIENKQYYEVIFHPNGGKNLSYQSITIAAGDVVDELPTVERVNYAFKGWYTQASGGEKITKATVSNKERILYAQWIRVTKPAKVRKPSVVNQENGQIRVGYKEVSGAKGYEIAYSSDKTFTTSSRATSTSSAKIIKNLERGRYYYIRVRAFKKDSTGRRIYGPYSEISSIRVY